MLLSMIRISKILTVKDMDNAIVKIEDAIADMAGMQNKGGKREKGKHIGAKIEGLRLKCILRGWSDQVDKFDEVLTTCEEVSRELSSARRSTKNIAANTNY